MNKIIYLIQSNMNTQFDNTFLFYRAQPLLDVHGDYGAKLFEFGSTNIAINLYIVVLKIAI